MQRFMLIAAGFITLSTSSWAAHADGTMVATVNNVNISSNDLDARAANGLAEADKRYELQLQQLKVNHERERHAYLERELGALVDERVLQLEAAAKKTTPALLKAAIKQPAVSDTDVLRFYVSKKAQIDRPYEEVAGQIRDFLEKQAKENAERSYLDSLRKNYHAAVTLPPLREAVAAIGPQRGPDDAPITIVEFSDYECPFCGRYEPEIESTLKRYPTQVRLVYRNMPLASLHPNAEIAAEAALCARDQGKFWEMHDLLFAEQGALGIAALKEKGKRLGLDTASFDACLDTGKSKAAVLADSQAADQLAISGTPASFINGRYVNGSVSAAVLSQIIDDELRRTGQVSHD